MSNPNNERNRSESVDTNNRAGGGDAGPRSEAELALDAKAADQPPPPPAVVGASPEGGTSAVGAPPPAAPTGGPTGEPTTQPTAPLPAGAKRPKKKGRWRRRIGIAVVVLLVLALGLRVAVNLAFPTVLAKVAGYYDLDCSYERLQLNVLGGDVGLWHLTVNPKTANGAAIDGGPLVHAEYVRGNIAPLKLLVGKLEVWRVEADGVELNVERTADGRIPALEKLLAARPAPAPAAKPAAGPTQIDLTPPLRVDALRLQHVRARVRDRAVSPPFDGLVLVNLRVSDVGSTLRPARFELDVSSDPILDSLAVEGEGRSGGAALDARMTVRVKGLRPRAAAGYLEPLGMRPVANEISMRMNARLSTAAAADGHPPTRPTSGASDLASAANASPADASPATLPASQPANPTGGATGGALAAAPAAAVTGTLVLENIAVLADGEESLAMDRLTLDADRVTPDAAQLARLVIDGVRGHARRTPEGNLRVAGVELVPPVAAPAGPATLPASRPAPSPADGAVATAADTTAEGPPVPQSAATRAAAAAPATAPTTAPASPLAMLPLRVTLGEFALRNVRMDLNDEAVAPAADLAMVVDELSARDIVLDPALPDAPVTVRGAFRAPGMANAVRLDATARPFAGRRSVELTFKAEGLAPDVLRPYLDALGLESRLKDGSVVAELRAAVSIGPDGRLGADARFGKLTFRDGDRELLALEDVRLDGLSLDPAAGRLRVDAVQIAGPRLAFRRDAGGGLEAFGFRTKAPTASRHPQSQPPAIRLAAIDIGKFVWKDVRVRFDDETVSPAASVNLTDAGVELTDFKLDLLAGSAPAAPGTIRGWLAAPGLAERLSVEGTVTPGADSVALNLQVAGQGVTAAGVAPYLTSLGIEPVLMDGTFKASATASLARSKEGDRLTATAELRGVTYADGPNELAGVDRVRLDGVTLAGTELALGNIEVDRPRARAARDESGALLAGGVRLTFPPAGVARPATAPSAPSAPSAAAAHAAGTDPAVAWVPTAPATQPSTQRAVAAPPFVATLQRLRVRNGWLAWTDRAVHPAVNTTAAANLDLENVTLGRKAGPATLRLAAMAQGAADSLTVTGTFSPDPGAPAARLDVAATGLRVGPLAPYLPPGLTVALKDGRLRTTVDAALAAHPDGGFGGRLLVNGLDYRDGPDGPPLLKADGVRLAASRVDVPGHVIAVDEITVAGAETDVVKAADGATRLLGLSSKAADTATAATAASGAGATTAPASIAAPAVASSPGTNTAAGTSAQAAAMFAQAHRVLPLVTVENLNVGVKRAAYTDASRPGAAPVAVTDLRLRNAGRIELLGPDPQGRPPVKLELTARVEPLADQITLSVQAAPFAADPTLQADFSATGVRGEGLTALVPGLKPKVDGAQLKDGRFKTHVEGQLKVDRRTPVDLDLSRGFGLDVSVRGTEFRAAPDGPVLAGLEELRADGVRVKPAESTVRIKRLEITKPAARLNREADGIHALGWVIKLPQQASAAGGPPTGAGAGAGAATQPAAPATAPPPATPAMPESIAGTPATHKPAGEIQVEKLVVSGLDVVVEDRTADPPLVVPLTALDVEVLGLSSLMPYEDRPLRFAATLGAGKVRVPRKARAGGVAGAIGDAAALLGGKKVETAPEFEDRELFAQVSASGRLSLYPEPAGWVKSSVSGLELAALSGPARQQGVSLSGGTFDSDVDLRFKGDGSADAKSKFVFTDLSVSEPPNGPIFRHLHLPAPLDAVIGVMEAADKSISVPLSFPVEKGKVSTGAVVGSATGALVQVITVALASTPVKAVSGVTSLVGLDAVIPGLGGQQPKAPERPIVIAFSPGATGLEEAGRRQLAALAERLRNEPGLEVTLKHDLGGGDVQLAAVRANPPAGDVAALSSRLRARRQELTGLRSAAAGQARAALAVGGGTDASAAVERLQAIDRELARTEDALDKLYDLLRPGAERQAARRSRSAALDIARDRLATARAALLAGTLGSTSSVRERVKVTNAQFAPGENSAGGTITATLVNRK